MIFWIPCTGYTVNNDWFKGIVYDMTIRRYSIIANDSTYSPQMTCI